jgi:hypothetical protein
MSISAKNREKTGRFECGETQVPCRPGLGRDPGKRRGADAWTPASAGATKMGITFPGRQPKECGYPSILCAGSWIGQK